MPTRPHSSTEIITPPFEGMDEPLAAQLPTFEVFFKTVGFKRIHGRVWGLLVLAGQPLSKKEIGSELGLSAGATSTAVNELTEWGAISSYFDSSRRCQMHEPVGNTISIVATVLRRREQVIFAKFKQGANETLDYVRKTYGEKDPRALTLRSIVSSCEIAEAVMQLVINSVASALGDSESLLSKAVNTALKFGLTIPGKLIPRPQLDGAETESPGMLPSGELPASFEEDESEEEALAKEPQDG
jgi:hypothetical protein